MNISVRWLNEYLVPANVTAEGAEHALTNAGFPIESHTELPDGDVVLDVEITSNRGDCLSHIGIAREVGAATGRSLKAPAVPARTVEAVAGGEPAGVTVENRAVSTGGCPMFTARVIKGVKVGPSPAWMVRALESVGARSINNVVDVTNYVSLEFGQPTHVFDLAKLRGGGNGNGARVIVRAAQRGERLKLLDGREVELAEGELVVADGTRPVSLAGIMGGYDTQVTGATTDVLLEAATWDPGTVRRAARRLQIRTDASHRFERTVDPRTIDVAARRAAALIVELAGGTLAPGVIEAGGEYEPLRTVALRPARCRAVIGAEIGAAEMARVLEAHEIRVRDEAGVAGGEGGSGQGGVLVCTIPAHRPDLAREIDLIEEVARTVGLEKVPVHEKIAVRVAEPQRSEAARGELARALTGLGFYETVTFSFVSPGQAAPFLPAGLERIDVSDERRKGEPTLRPSVLPSLLACRRKNQDGGVTAEGGVRLYEIAAVFAQDPAARGAGPVRGTVERVNLGLVADAEAAPGHKGVEAGQRAVRLMRGVIESLVGVMGGAGAAAAFTALREPPVAAYDGAGTAEVTINGDRAGLMGLCSGRVLKEYGLDRPVVMAELSLSALTDLYPGRATVSALPVYPGIERDLSLIVPERVTWAEISALVRRAELEKMEEGAAGLGFVTTYRGATVGAGKKSVTLRVRFRDASRTLRREEVDPQMATLVALACRELGAEVRA